MIKYCTFGYSKNTSYSNDALKKFFLIIFDNFKPHSIKLLIGAKNGCFRASVGVILLFLSYTSIYASKSKPSGLHLSRFLSLIKEVHGTTSVALIKRAASLGMLSRYVRR